MCRDPHRHMHTTAAAQDKCGKLGVGTFNDEGKCKGKGGKGRWIAGVCHACYG